MPTEVPPGSADFLPTAPPVVQDSYIPGEPPIELPGEAPSFQEPTYSDPGTVGDPPISDGLEALPQLDPTPQFDPPSDLGFATPVPQSQVPNDQSVLDPLPLAGQQAVTPAAPSADLFAASTGSTNAGAGIPAMFGDFCGLGARPLFTSPMFGAPIAASTPVAGGDCRHKWAEFTAPCPADRIFFTYHHYNNGLIDVNGRRGDADQFTFGFEKSFWNNLASFETRMSFLGGGLESTQIFGDTDTFGAELGNLATTFKVLLINERRYAVSTGITTIWPTGDDGLFDSFAGQMEIRNESIHVMPFLAWLYKPNQLWFHQGNVQIDIDITGDTILFGNGRADVIQDQRFLYLDYSIGRWLYANNHRFVRRAAALCELHYSTSISDADVGNSGAFAGGSFNILNATAGMHFQLGNATTFRIGAGAPLRKNDRAFDSEITVQLAKYF